MKAQVSVAIGALVVLTSCGGDNPVAPKPTPTPSVIDVPAACAFSVSPTTVSFGSNGGTQNVTLTATPAGCSPQTWTASSSGSAVTANRGQRQRDVHARGERQHRRGDGNIDGNDRRSDRDCDD